MFSEWLSGRLKPCRPLARQRGRRLSIDYLEQRTVLSTGLTITYNQITALPSTISLDGDAPFNVLSADGNRAVFQASDPSGVPQVYTINSDGSGLTLVDPNAKGQLQQLDISADGSVVLEQIAHGNDGTEFRIVNADGSNQHDAFDTETYSTEVNARISADGSTVFFEDAAPFTVNNTTYPAGLYQVAAAGGTPQLIASLSQVAAVAGLSASDVYMGPAEGLDLDASSDGTHLVFAASTNGGDFLLGVNSDGTDLHLIGPPAQPSDNISEAGISGDGTKVFRYDSGDALPNGPKLTVYNFDGSGQVTLNVPNGLQTIGAEQVELTQDGSKLLLGSTALLINTDNSGVVQLGTDVGIDTLVHPSLYHPTMNSSGTEILYTMTDLNDEFQLAVAQINPSSLGGDPAISNVTINPSYLLTQDQSSITVTAAVSASTTPVGVSEAFQLNGVDELYEFSDDRLSATANAGTYSNNDITTESTQTGPRGLRISAETIDSSGLQHVTTVEVDGALNVVTASTQPPAITAPRAVSVNQNATLAFTGGNAISVADAGGTAATGQQLTVSVSHGTLTLGTTTGLTVTGNGTASVTAAGPLSSLNADLASLTYAPASGYNGSDTLALSDEDQVDTLTASGQLAITVNPPAPTLKAPSSVGVNENGSVTFSGSNAITLTDAAAAGSSDALSLTVTHGTLTLGSTTGLTFSSGASGSASMTVTGTVANLNAALNGLKYVPTSGFSGQDSMVVTLTDAGDGLSGSATVSFTIQTSTGNVLFSDSFNRPNATEDNLGQADNFMGGTGTYYYVPIFSGADIASDTLEDNGVGYGGVEFTTSSDTGATRGTDVGQDLDITVSLLVPAGSAGSSSSAGVFFRSRAAFTGDGILGGQPFDPSGGYWVRLLSTGSIQVVDDRTNTVTAFTGQPVSFNTTEFHTLEVAFQGNDLQVALDGVLQGFNVGGTMVAIPPTGLPGDTTLAGDVSAGNAGTAGIAFGKTGSGAQVKDLVVTNYSSIAGLPTSPTSTVKPLSATTTATSFTVSWSGSPGSGASSIASYEIFVSDNGGAFTPFLTSTTKTSATFTGRVGQKYGFYSVATNNLGIVQPEPAAAQATISVVAPPLVRLTNVQDVMSKNKVTEVILTFSGPLSAAEADNTGIYRLATPGTHGSYTAKNAGVIRLRQAAYSSAKDKVTLTPQSPFALKKPVELVVNETPPFGLQDTLGRFLDGGKNAVAILGNGGVTIEALVVRTAAARPALAPSAVDAVLERDGARS